MPGADHFFRLQHRSRRVNAQVGDRVMQVKPLVEPIGRGAETGLCVPGVFHGLPVPGRRIEAPRAVAFRRRDEFHNGD